MDDTSTDVVEAASTILLPILAQWGLSLKMLQSHLLSRILSKLRSLMKPSNSPTKDHVDGNRAASLFTVLKYLLPHTIICVVDTEAVRKRTQESVSPQLREFIFIIQLEKIFI